MVQGSSSQTAALNSYSNPSGDFLATVVISEVFSLGAKVLVVIAALDMDGTQALPLIHTDEYHHFYTDLMEERFDPGTKLFVFLLGET